MISSSSSRSTLIALRNTADEAVDLATAALDIAALDRPGISLAPYHRHLDTLAQAVAKYAGTHADIERAHEALVQIIAKQFGYGGTETSFDDLNSANLACVIDTRNGLPVALGIIYIHAARAQGWSCAGIDFPGRFLVRLDVDGERRIFDPFEGGIVLDSQTLRNLLKAGMGNEAELTPDHYRDLDNRGILIRLENNLKVRHLHAERYDEALRVIDTILLFAPDTAALWREAGIIHARLDRIQEAISALEEYLRLDTSATTRYSATVLLQELRSRLT